MAATTTQLGLVTPTQGDLSGTWGNTVNNGITEYTNIAIAGTTTFNGDGAVTLVNTTGDASATNIASTSAQYMIVRVTGTLTTAKIITFGSAGSAPYSKLYLVDNSATGGIVTFKAYGQTGVSVAVGEKTLVFYNGTDIVKVATTTSGVGDVVGPASAVANSIALFNSTTGKLIKDSSASDGLIYGLTVGRGAGAVATNTAVGASALAANTSGATNTAVGSGALAANTSGANNTAIGYNAFDANTTGSGNTAMGQNAIGANTAGADNTGIGYGALGSGTSGSANTAVGRGALSDNTGSNNTALGYFALISNTTASNNVAVGYQAGYTNSTGTNLTYIGQGAGYYQTGNTNTAVGTLAMQGTSGSSNGTGNNAFGYASLFKNTSGSLNSGFGDASLSNNTTGANNTAVGYQALQANTTASNNTAVGYQAGYTGTTAANNSWVGYNAGKLCTGNYNTGMGDRALAAMASAEKNSAFGMAAAINVTTGSYNTAIGSSALENMTTGSTNTAVGYASAYLITTGSKNTILGSFSGNQGGLDIRTASNYIVLSDGDGNPRMYNNGTDWYDAAGKLRAIPQSGSAKTSSYTLATTDVGEFIEVGASGAIVVPNATFSTGDVVSIFNNTSGNITMTMSITTAYIGGTDSDKATITLATRGVATVLFISGTVCVVNGNVS